MSRLARRKDGNQGEIEAELRRKGMFVFDTSRTGFGFPDLCVFVNGRVVLVEVKMLGEQLTDREASFFWTAKEHGVRVVIAYTSDQAVMDVLNAGQV